MICRNHNWVGLLVASLLWKHTWDLLVPQEIVLREEAFKSVAAWEPVVPVSEVYGFFSNRDLPPNSGSRATKGNSNSL